MKKLLALILAGAMILSSCTFAVAEISSDTAEPIASAEPAVYIDDLVGKAEGSSNETETLLSEYTEVLKSICPSLKTYSDINEKVSRADFLTMLTALVYGSGYPVYTGFTDVSSDNAELLNSLSCAVKVGAISPAETFRPDDKITYPEMYKVAVVATGYKMLAEQGGGYPAGYLNIASQAGLDENTLGNSGEVSAYDAYTVLFNVITVEFMEQTSFGETERYTVSRGNSILKARYNTEIIEGIVNADQVTSLTSEDGALSQGEITIGVNTYRNSSSKSLLGYNVKAYVRTVGKISEVISIHKYENREVYLDEFSLESDFTFRSFADNGKTTDYRLYKGYSAILNNVAAPYISLADYTNRDDVTVYLVDNNNDRLYDVVKIYDWDYMQVGKIDPVNMILYSANPPQAASDGRVTEASTLNLDSGDVHSKIYDCVNDSITPISFESIAADDVITYAVSANLKSVVIFRSAQKITGVLDECNLSDNILWVGGTEYKISSYAGKRFPNYSLGEDTTLYLDATGVVIALKQGDEGFMYGYIVAMGSESVLDGDFKIKMFTQNGTMEFFTVAKNLYVDNAKTAASDLNAMEDNLSDDDRMVKYSLGSKGEIISIDFAENANSLMPFTESKPERNSFTLYYDANLERLGDGSFGSAFMADGSTKIFQIPKSAQYKNDESYYLIKSYSDYRNGFMDIRAYDMAPGAGPKVILYFTDAQTIKVDVYTASVVFLGATDGINAEGEPCKLMTTYTGSVYNKYCVDNSLDISGLIPGDIIAISVYKNEVIDMNLHYSYYTNAITAPSSEYCTFYKGYVYAYGSRMLQLWDTMNINNQVNISDILGLDFREQKVTFIDLYKDSNGKIYKAMARYKPLAEIKDYLSCGTNADFMVVRMSGNSYQNKWIYRVIER